MTKLRSFRPGELNGDQGSADIDKSTFGSDTAVAGALLPADARELIVRSHGVPPGAIELARDGWVAQNIPVLVRGKARIIPLAWSGAADREYNPAAEPSPIKAFASHVEGAALHRAGPWSEMDLAADTDDSVGSYRDALRTAGATRAHCWAYSETVGLALVWAGTEEHGDQSLAVHLIPASWAIRRLAGAPVDGIDVRWSWNDVIALAYNSA